MAFKHKSVLLDETIEGLNIKPDGIYVDGTLGGGGHAYEVCRRLNNKGSFIGIDQDAAAIEAAGTRLSDFGERVTIIRSNYCDMKSRLHEKGIDKVDGIVLDLGVSSYQLDTADRGFSYRVDAPLDMRMDTRQTLSAKEIVNGYSEMDLFRIIRDYGEDKFAKNIAKHIVMAREKGPIETTGQLAEIIRQSIPMKFQKMSGHPAKRTFQAIRIECNRELEVLRDSLDDMIDILNPGGRICIITFHSLEDRIVKGIFKKNENPCTCPSTFPVCVCGKVSKGKVITKKPILPSEEEMEVNSRSKSAKLRIFERVENLKGWCCMAKYSHRIQADRRTVTSRGMYIYGNTVRQAEVMPQRQEEPRKEHKKKKLDRQILKNRRKAMRMNPAYVMFLSIAAVAALVVCVWYLQVRAELTSRTEHITELQQELADAKEENTTRYNVVMDSVNLEEVRDRAINDLGMGYATSDQIIEYQNPVNDYVKQYESIPKSGVLGQTTDK